MALPAIGAIIGGIGSVIGSIFGFKGKQAEIVKSSVDLIGTIQSDEAKAQVAVMTAIVAEAQSESWLTRMWRPMAFMGFLLLIFAYFFGYAPSNVLADSLPPIVERIFSLLEVVLLAGYPSRTLEKMTRQIQLGRLLRTFIEKKIL